MVLLTDWMFSELCNLWFEDILLFSDFDVPVYVNKHYLKKKNVNVSTFTELQL